MVLATKNTCKSIENTKSTNISIIALVCNNISQAFYCRRKLLIESM